MKTTTVKIISDTIFSGMELLKPDPGDIIIMRYKTDQFGNCISPIEDMQNSVNLLNTAYNNEHPIVVMSDKIYIDSIETGQKTINILKNVIEYIKDEMKRFENFQQEEIKEAEDG